MWKAACGEKNQIEEFLHTQEADIQQAECDAAEDADRVREFDDYASAVVP
jgi:hypothetical protein